MIQSMLNMIKLILKIGMTLISLIIIGVILINIFVVMSSRQKIVQAENMDDYISDDTPVLVLGAGVIDNAYPSNILKARLDKAYELYQQAPHKSFIMSGDHQDQYYDEVSVMKNYLIEKGIPEQQIFLDHCGYSTYDSLYRLKNVIKESRVITITQEYHLSRAIMVSQKLKLDAVGIAAEEVPSTRLNREIREVFARLKDFAVCYLNYKPQPPETNFAFKTEEDASKTDKKENLRK